MCEHYREQHPLLCDDYSDNEFKIQSYSPRYQRSRTAYSGRARCHAKGAAAILKRWPDYWTSSLTYWWVGLGMIAVTVFVIYNSVAALALFPPAHVTGRPQIITNNLEIKLSHKSSLPEVYLHLFVENDDVVDLNKYYSHIEKLWKKYPRFNYNLIVVNNDTSIENNDLSDETNNLEALNSLWTDKLSSNHVHVTNNIIVKYQSLTKYMHDSPLKKYWRYLPGTYIAFLVRCISVWEKGGVAFNPIILTSSCPDPVYKKKIRNILDNFEMNNSNSEIIGHKKDEIQVISRKKTVNNIRDIINALETENFNSKSQDNLSMAEDIYDGTILRQNNSDIKMSYESQTKDQMNVTKTNNISQIHKRDTSFKETNTEKYSSLNEIEKPRENLLPSFLKYLFHNSRKSNYSDSYNTNETMNHTSTHNKETYKIKEREHILPKINSSFSDINDELNTIGSNENNVKLNRSVSKTQTKKKYIPNINYNSGSSSRLTIDLKGNLIATKTGCHAFIGTIFSNVAHHTEGSITDFIISELSVFCKGLLTSCSGIDVILV